MDAKVTAGVRFLRAPLRDDLDLLRDLQVALARWALSSTVPA